MPPPSTRSTPHDAASLLAFVVVLSTYARTSRRVQDPVLRASYFRSAVWCARQLWGEPLRRTTMHGDLQFVTSFLLQISFRLDIAFKHAHFKNKRTPLTTLMLARQTGESHCRAKAPI